MKHGDQLDGWVLIERLGRGGNAEVWLAEDGENRAAVKVMHRAAADRLARFSDEIAFLLEGGPGVLPLINHSLPETSTGPRWYAMPLARPLRESLGEAATASDVVGAAAEIAETLAQLAAKGIGHRDIKPANLYEFDGAYLVGDFGLATYPEKNPLSPRHTYHRARSSKEMPASTDPAPAFSPRCGGGWWRRRGYSPWRFWGRYWRARPGIRDRVSPAKSCLWSVSPMSARVRACPV